MLSRISKLMVFIILVVIVLLPCSNHTVYSSSDSLFEDMNNLTLMYVASSKAYVNGKEVNIDETNPDVFPFVWFDRTMVPVRFLAENFGAKVSWDAKSSTTTIETNKKTVKITEPDEYFMVNLSENELDNKALIVNSKLYIPLKKMVEEILEKKVCYYNGLIILSDKDINIEKIKIDKMVELFGKNENQYLYKMPGSGYINSKGKVVIKPQYITVNDFSEGLASIAFFSSGGAYINSLGNIIIRHSYSSAGDFHEGLAAIGIKGKGEGFIDKTGKIVIQPQYDSVGNFSQGLAVVVKDDKCWYIDKNGNNVVDKKFDVAGSFCDGLAAVQVNGKYGYIDMNGKYINDTQYDNAYDFSEGLAGVFITGIDGKGKWGVIDKTGKYVVEPRFDEIRNFTEGLAFVKINGKYGCIDKTGNFVIEPKYESAYGFSEGLALVSDGLWGYIDKKGEYIIDPQFIQAESFSHGLAAVNNGTFKGYIGKDGKFVWQRELTEEELHPSCF